MPTCQGFKKNGEACNMYIKNGIYCYHHKKPALKKSSNKKPTAKKSTIKQETKSKSKLGGRIIVFTGSLSITRKKATGMAEISGAKVNTSISKKTNIVVAGPGAGMKLEKAKDLKIPIWTEKEFMNSL
jgi:NAD-dependent DNA ligase